MHDPAIMVFDVRSPATPVQLTESRIITEDNESRVRFEADVQSSSAFYAATPELFFDSCSGRWYPLLTLEVPALGIDYIIAHNQFLAEVENLKTIREQGGLGVEIVDVQDIYDEFSYGIKDVTAIKDFLRYAYSNWHQPRGTGWRCHPCDP